MIALTMAGNQKGDTDFNSKCSELRPQELAPQDLWTPRYPRRTTMVPPPGRIESQTFQPILNIDFGGAEGANLPRITRIVAHMYDRNDAVVGFAFHFDGQEPIFRGRQGQTEVSFFVNGAGGERITEVTYERALTYETIWSLRVCLPRH